MKQIPSPLRLLGQRLRPPRLSLRLAFTLPVVAQLLLAVGLVGYLSFRNGQRAVTDLASQLRSEVSARIEGELIRYFGDPHAINRLNATAFINGDIDIVGASQGEHLMFQQMKIYPTIAFVYCGSAQSGEFFGILRNPETGELQLSYGNITNNYFREYYSLDVRGYRQHFVFQATETYDARRRPWFTAALQAETPTWTDVYLAFTTQLPNVTASLPVYDRQDRNLLGVCATDVVLPQEFHTFLKQLDIGPSGQAYVIDREGHLIASSTAETLTTGDSDNLQFLDATASNNILVQRSSAHLLQRFGNFDAINDTQQLSFNLWGQRQYLEVLPFNDDFGLDWLIVVVVPEADYMGRIHLNNRITVVLCLLGVGVALGVGVLLAGHITQPIVQLNATVGRIAEGNWQQRVLVRRYDEVGQLAQSVNSMAAQIQQSFDSLEQQRNAFSRFFPPEYLQFLNKETVTDIELGDHVSQDMAVMFSDIRGFTSLAEKIPPQEAFNFINAYLQRISPEVRKHHGFVVKYLGDGVMAVFPNRVEDAIDAAIAQFRQVENYNQQRRASGKFAIEIGIGLHAGRVMTGMIGEHNRIQPDAVSDAVNLAARLEGLSKVYGCGLIVSAALCRRLPVPHPYHLRFLDRTVVKGRSEPIAIYEVLDAEVPAKRRLKLETLPDFEAAMQAYLRNDFRTAQTYFERVLAQNPDDKTALLYCQRVKQMRTEGTPQDWDGVWIAGQK